MSAVPPAGPDWLPRDLVRASLIGRMDLGDGPTPVLIRQGRLFDLSGLAPTVADVLNRLEPAEEAHGLDLGPFDGVAPAPGAPPRLLAPIDLQCVKAAGVTFAVSTLERVIEEHVRGDASQAQAIRSKLAGRIGVSLDRIEPGSPAAAHLKQALIADGLWSQYLEVAIGPDAEIFTKAPVLASVGHGAQIGVRADSAWNNPEPEVVLICDGKGRIRGASLGNDVNLRDFEGRSALLLGKAKDNNASCAIGPFIRLFDETFTLEDVRKAEIRLQIVGEDGFHLSGSSRMDQMSRRLEDLVSQTFSRHHQYPDGVALFTGTMFAPVQDRDVEGQGFTHRRGDQVTISTETLGALTNQVAWCHEIEPWTFGVGALMRNLASRGLIQERQA